MRKENIKNKVLVFLAVFLSVFISSWTRVNSETVWKVGDQISTNVLCETEKDILDIAYADSHTEFLLKESLQIKLIQRKCVIFNPPITLRVQKIISNYMDYNKVPSLILSASTLKEDDTIGYLIVVGRSATEKETTY